MWQRGVALLSWCCAVPSSLPCCASCTMQTTCYSLLHTRPANRIHRTWMRHLWHSSVLLTTLLQTTTVSEQVLNSYWMFTESVRRQMLTMNQLLQNALHQRWDQSHHHTLIICALALGICRRLIEAVTFC